MAPQGKAFEREESEEGGQHDGKQGRGRTFVMVMRRRGGINFEKMACKTWSYNSIVLQLYSLYVVVVARRNSGLRKLK